MQKRQHRWSVLIFQFFLQVFWFMELLRDVCLKVIYMRTSLYFQCTQDEFLFLYSTTTHYPYQWQGTSRQTPFPAPLTAERVLLKVYTLNINIDTDKKHQTISGSAPCPLCACFWPPRSCCVLGHVFETNILPIFILFLFFF